MAALEDLGYQPTTTQRVLPRDPVVAVVFDTLVNPYSAQVLRGVLTAAKEMSVDIVVEVINDGPGTNRPLSKSWLKSIAQKGWTGVLGGDDRDHAQAVKSRSARRACAWSPSTRRMRSTTRWSASVRRTSSAEFRRRTT